ncbi:cholinesterase-like [Brevipalpus obovatus]|uniref:cholinesterase-like n=1 Tax=Brevipalpus obovatus TaxID=246614 RepID=UPI003D9EA311
MNRLIIFVSLFLVFASSSVTGNRVAPQIQTKYGPVQGMISQYREVNVLEYKGIPYAKAPINENRFLPPTKPDPWTIPQSGENYGNACIQQWDLARKNQSEDCLFINVFVNEESYYKEKSLPVMVYIHGGAFIGGSGDLTGVLGANPLVPIHDVVLVSFNYRLGALGFLLPDKTQAINTNLGFRDQIFALQWVQDNIYLFAGDSSRVTIFGESAGSKSVGLHIISPLSANLFTNAIMQSGALWHGDVKKTETILASNKLIEDVGCSGQQDILACLQKVDVADLMKPVGPLQNPFLPNFHDSDVFPSKPYEAITQGTVNVGKNVLAGAELNDGAIFLAFDDVSLLLGNVTYQQAVDAVHFFTKNQSSDFFIDHYLKPHKKGSSDDIKKALWAFTDDLLYKCPTYFFASSYGNVSSSGSGNVYAYIHTQKPKTSNPICTKIAEIGPCHGDDLPFVFGAPFRQPDLYSRLDDDLSSQMMQIWTSFGKYGRLYGQDPSYWPTLGQKQQKNFIMELNGENIGKLYHEKMDFCIVNWQSFQSVYDPSS